jgi:two-component system chemotaxis sensor kinase CheA
MKEEEFFIKLLGTFRIEAEEHINALSAGLIALEGSLSLERRKQEIERIFREAHSLKGAARAVNQRSIEKICQELENVLAAWKQGQIQPSAEDFSTLYATIDAIDKAIFRTPEPETLSKVVKQLEEIRNPKSSYETASLPSKTEEKTIEKAEEKTERKDEAEGSSPPLPEKQPAIKIHSNLSQETLPDKSIRISLAKMSQLFQQAEEMLIVKLISQKQLIELKHLYVKKQEQEKELVRLIDDLRILWQRSQSKIENLQNPRAMERILFFLNEQQRHAKSFKESLGHLIRNAGQDHYFVESLVDNLLNDAKKLLMQPMNTLFESIPRMIRDIAHDLKKEINLEIEGGDIEIDRRILEEIKDPLIHIIRNAIDHGIESPSERKKSNKPSAGTIRIVASESSGNHVALSIIDDGRGMNIERIKSAAIQRGILTPKESAELSEEETIKLALHAGISTSSAVTELSGRGLGLGIVSEKVNQLRGQVTIDSKPNQGTTFTLILPLTLATFRGIHITVTNQDFIMPIHNIKRVLRLKKEDISTVANQETITLDNSSISFIHLANILGLARKSKQSSSCYALVISAVEKTIAFGADEVNYEEEFLVKGLGKQCVRVKNILAATVTEQGNVIPILNPLDLIKSALRGKISPVSKIEEQIDKSQKEILLVEDSITTRLMLKNVLESANYKVRIAVDGLDALEVLSLYSVDLILTDIEMPRMDGFTLIEKVKEMDNLKQLPIVIFTSRDAKEVQSRGIQLGVNAFLDKNHFTQQELMNVLKKIL